MSSLDGLANDLQAAQAKARPAVEGVVKKGALNVKNDWRQRSSGLAHAPAFPSSITYDVLRSPSTVTAEIGPDKSKRQGALGNLLEFGSVNNPPRLDGQAALDTEAPKFEQAIAAVERRLL